MGSTAEKHGWIRGGERPALPGIFEICYMGRRMLVNVKRVSGSCELLVYGVPGHMEEGLPVSDFDMYSMPRTDDSRRTAASNLGEYDRAVSRVVASLTALRAVISEEEFEEEKEMLKKATAIDNLNVQIAVACKTVADREGVKEAIEERLGLWDREDHEAIPLPSEGLGSPEKGKDLHGRDV